MPRRILLKNRPSEAIYHTWYHCLKLSVTKQIEEIAKNHSYGDGADATRNGSEDGGGVDVAGYLLIEFARAGVNEGDATLKVLRLDKARVSGTRDDNVRVFEIVYRAFFEREHGYVGSQTAQKPRRGRPDKSRCGKDEGPRSGYLYVAPGKYLNNRERNGRMHEALFFRNFRVEGVHVLLRGNGGEKLVDVDSLRKRQLYDNCVGVRHKPLYYLLDLSRIAFFGDVDAHHLDTEALGGARLDAHERFDDRVRADNHYAELRRTGQFSEFWREAGVDVFCNCFPVNTVCIHVSPISFFNSAMPSSSFTVGSHPKSSFAFLLSASVSRG